MIQRHQIDAELTDLRARALTSLCILTGHKPDGRAELVAAILKRPFRSQQRIVRLTGKFGRGCDHTPCIRCAIE